MSDEKRLNAKLNFTFEIPICPGCDLGDEPHVHLGPTTVVDADAFEDAIRRAKFVRGHEVELALSIDREPGESE